MSDNLLHNIKNRSLSDEEAAKILISLIEHSDNTKLRIDCLNVLTNIKNNSKNIYNLIEMCLVSDESPLVRATAAELIVIKFLKHAFNPLSWVIEKENSLLVLTKIFATLKYINTDSAEDLKQRIIARFSKIYGLVIEEAEFLCHLYSLAIEKEEDFKNIQDFIRDRRFVGSIEVPTLLNQNFTPRFEIKQNQIVSLDLFFWKLRELPESISNLSNLRYLTLNCENLVSLPQSFDLLKKIKWIELSGIPKFKSIPDWILSIVKKCHSRIYLKNGIKEIEAITIGLLDLLSGYELYELGPSQSIHNYSQIYAYRLNKKGNVSELYISNPRKFKLSILPEQIKNLKELTLLDLNSNEIEIIPNSLSFLKSLKYLNLSNNKIKEIPISIGSLTSLEFLDLSGNEIEKLPESFIKLENLRSLKLENNLIDCLPTSMKSTLTFKKRINVP